MSRHGLVVAAALIFALAQPLFAAQEVEETWRSSWGAAWSVSVNPTDGSCWVTDWDTDDVVHFGADGTELWRGTSFLDPECVAVNPNDGSCWVADSSNGHVVHVSAGGTELWRGGGFGYPDSVAVDPNDGSCWIGDWYNDEIIHVSSLGTILWRGGDVIEPESVAVNASDRSVWVADNWNGQIVHLASNGTELWRSTASYDPWWVDVNPNDGSCWVADSYYARVLHFSAAGALLFQGTNFSWPESVAVNPNDGSVWVVDSDLDELVHLSAGGTEISRIGGFRMPMSVSVNPNDGAVWVADYGNGQVVRLAPLFWDVAWGSWAYDQIAACCDAGIVSGYGNGSYRPGAPVTRDQMAVYVARALAGGDSGVPGGPATPSFLDVPNTGYGDGGTDPYWAYKYVEYAVEENVVQGYAYEDPEHPGETLSYYEPLWAVTRDQMAVYIARAMVAPSGEAALEDYIPSAPRNFPDIPSTGYGDDGTDPFWAYKHIEYCVENEVVLGYYDGYYYPENPVTRDQMAVYIARAFELPIP